MGEILEVSALWGKYNLKCRSVGLASHLWKEDKYDYHGEKIVFFRVKTVAIVKREFLV